MAPFLALIVSFLVFRLLGFLGWAYVADWQGALRLAVAIMFLLTASAHWGKRRPDLVRMVPPVFPQADMLVTLTGWLEILGALTIVFPGTARYASIGLAILLLLLFPANVYAAQKKLTLGGKPVTPLGLRTILQVVFLAAVVLAGM
ncbi:DoxX family protein [Brevibacillus fluminis]|uniref:DoxX family protein n=1 Tax=Brevibacillus fluminis TaxID=511487 RepID=UPI003F8996AB